MSLVLNTNISSMIAQNSLTSSGSQLATSLQQLSSGLRINTAADDAAGYAIVQGMTSQINGINQAANNANDGVSLAQTASGALTEITNDLQTMRDLAVQSLNATNSSSDRADLDAQFQQLKADINSVASQTQFNGVNLLDGSFQGATFQVGANAGQSITMSSISSAAANNLGQLYTAAATDPTAYTTTGAAVGAGVTAVASGDAGSFTITAGGTTYKTSAVTLTGTQATDLKTIAAAINQATGTAGIVATVDSSGKGIDLSSTSSETVGVSYAATTGAETLASFGLKASNALGTTPASFASAASTGISGTAYTAALGAGAGSDTVTLTVGSTTLSPITLTGNQATDLAAINSAVEGAAPGVTGTINANGGIDFTSATSQSVTVSAAFGGTGGGTPSSPGTTTFSTATPAAVGTADVIGDATDKATFTVTVGGTPVTTAAVSLTGDQTTDSAAVAAALTTALAGTGVTAAANGSGGIDFTSATTQTITVASAFTAADGSSPAVGTEDGTTFGFAATSGTVALTTGTTTGASAGTPGTAAQGTETLSDLGLGSGTIAITTSVPATANAPSGTLDTSNVQTTDSSNQVLIQVDAALQQLATTGAQLGAYQNRFSAAVTGLNTDSTNLTSARSQIQDTDYASATSALSKAQILQQASTAMVAQANTIPQNILTLLQKLP